MMWTAEIEKEVRLGERAIKAMCQLAGPVPLTAATPPGNKLLAKASDASPPERILCKLSA
jgi:hypothetical protein